MIAARDAFVQVFRGRATVGRLGGDEFAILVPLGRNTRRNRIPKLIEITRERFANNFERNLFNYLCDRYGRQIANQVAPGFAGFSAGVSFKSELEKNDFDRMLDNADERMYREKQARKKSTLAQRKLLDLRLKQIRKLMQGK